MRFREECYKASLNLYTMGPPGKGGTVALLFHGGAWVGGDPMVLREHCTFLASQGITAMSAEYRMLPHGARTIVDESIVDAIDACGYVLNRVRPAQLFIIGASSGGLLAVHVARTWAPRVDGVVLFNPVVDLLAGKFKALPRPVPRALSPVELTFPAFPSTLTFQGERDRVTPVGPARRFAGHLRLFGVPVVFRAFAEAEHGFSADPRYRGATFSTMRAFIRGELPAAALAEAAARGTSATLEAPDRAGETAAVKHGSRV